ncbi:hypothetical protein ILUMI_23425 [Ignelater luminosus]|uniref:Zinc finger protein Rlf/292/654 TPR repeats domain-containing protein n=1 Tax=Ignelater luminosus TaxID=2038154 RepID=A0A8K0CCI1_IGNLU|nr:hypothetical protein ILUMI_23425 [Ignelater luminosus]
MNMISENTSTEYNAFKRLEFVLNNKSESFPNKVESLIQVWIQVSQCRLTEHKQYVVHLMDWLKLHTLNIVLTGDWKKFKDTYEEKLLRVVKHCEMLLLHSNNIYSLRCRKLAEVIKDPWGNPTLNRLLNDPEVVIGPQEIEFFSMETGYLISTRLRKLCESHCEDLALNLVSAFMQCQEMAEAQHFSMNATEDQKRFILDVYIALLYKYKKTELIISKLKNLSLMEGLELLKRFAHKRVNISKIWRHSNRIAHLAAQVYVTAAVVKPPEESVTILETLLDTWFSLNEATENLDSLMSAIRRIIQPADSAVHLYIFCEAVHKKFGARMKTFTIELYIRALTTGMNDLERQKNEDDTVKVAETTRQLAHGFLCLADVLEEHTKVSRECVLTSFSLQPTEATLDRIVRLAELSGHEVLDTGQNWKCKLHPPVRPTDELCWKCDVCGDYMSQPHFEAVLNTNTALNEALTAEQLGLSSQLCDDLVVVLSSPRYQLFNWLLRWQDLHRLCVLYLNDPEGTKNLVTELKFLDIDYSMFMGMKREPEDEELTGIERGYERFLEEEIYTEERISPTSEDSVSQDSRPYSSGSDGMGEHINLLPPPSTGKSDPNVLKSLRLFRPNLKRSKPNNLHSEVPPKVFVTSESVSPLAMSSTGTAARDKHVNAFIDKYLGGYNLLASQMQQQQIYDASKSKLPTQTYTNPHHHISQMGSYRGHPNTLWSNYKPNVYNVPSNQSMKISNIRNLSPFASTQPTSSFVHPRIEHIKRSLELVARPSEVKKASVYDLSKVQSYTKLDTGIVSPSSSINPNSRTTTQQNFFHNSKNGSNFLVNSSNMQQDQSCSLDKVNIDALNIKSRWLQIKENLKNLVVKEKVEDDDENQIVTLDLTKESSAKNSLKNLNSLDTNCSLNEKENFKNEFCFNDEQKCPENLVIKHLLENNVNTTLSKDPCSESLETQNFHTDLKNSDSPEKAENIKETVDINNTDRADSPEKCETLEEDITNKLPNLENVSEKCSSLEQHISEKFPHLENVTENDTNSEQNIFVNSDCAMNDLHKNVADKSLVSISKDVENKQKCECVSEVVISKNLFLESNDNNTEKNPNSEKSFCNSNSITEDALDPCVKFPENISLPSDTSEISHQDNNSDKSFSSVTATERTEGETIESAPAIKESISEDDENICSDLARPYVNTSENLLVSLNTEDKNVNMSEDSIVCSDNIVQSNIEDKESCQTLPIPYVDMSKNVITFASNGTQSEENHCLQIKLNKDNETETHIMSAVEDMPTVATTTNSNHCNHLKRHISEEELIKKYKIKEARVILHRLSLAECLKKKLIKLASKFLKPSLPTRKQPMRELKKIMEKSENKATDKRRRKSNIDDKPKNGLKPWPLKDINPKVNRRRDIKLNIFRQDECKGNFKTDVKYMNPRVVLKRLEFDKEKKA